MRVPMGISTFCHAGFTNQSRRSVFALWVKLWKRCPTTNSTSANLNSKPCCQLAQRSAGKTGADMPPLVRLGLLGAGRIVSTSLTRFATCGARTIRWPLPTGSQVSGSSRLCFRSERALRRVSAMLFCGCTLNTCSSGRRHRCFCFAHGISPSMFGLCPRWDSSKDTEGVGDKWGLNERWSFRRRLSL